MNVELDLGTEVQSGVELQNEAEAYSNFDISVHESDVEFSDREVHIIRI